MVVKTSENKGQVSVSSRPQENPSHPKDSPVEQTLPLQLNFGNQAVQRLSKSGTIQAKLKVGSPNDKCEQEADQLAEQAIRMPEPLVSKQLEEEGEMLQVKPVNISPMVQRQGEEEEGIKRRSRAKENRKDSSFTGV